MPIVMRYDSDGTAHQVWAQEQASSCGVASIWMARGQARRMTFMESEWQLAWRMYGQVMEGLWLATPAPAPMTLDPSRFANNQNCFQNTFAVAGTFMRQLTAALEMDGLRVTAQTPFSPGAAVDPAMLSEATPAIILLGWYNGTRQRRGGHFIVASRVTGNGRIVYLDPWEGRLHELGTGPNFPGGGQFEQIAYISA